MEIENLINNYYLLYSFYEHCTPEQQGVDPEVQLHLLADAVVPHLCEIRNQDVDYASDHQVHPQDDVQDRCVDEQSVVRPHGACLGCECAEDVDDVRGHQVVRSSDEVCEEHDEDCGHEALGVEVLRA